VAPPGEPTVLTAEQLQRDRDRVPLAELIVDAYPNWNGFFSSLVANWSPDGKHIVFGSLRDGLPEIYAAEVAKPSAAPRQITRGQDRAIWGRYSVDGKQILFLRDANGDENHHIWSMNADGTGLRDLTPGETLHRDEPVLPRKRPSLMLYSASRTTSPSSMLFMQSLTGGAPRLIYKNPNPGGLSDVSPDGTRALFVEWHSPDDVVLLEVAVGSGKARRVYPAVGKKVGIFSANYSADGRRTYVATDEGVESSVFLAFEVPTNREVARYVNDEPSTAPMNALVSPVGDRVVVRRPCPHLDRLATGEYKFGPRLFHTERDMLVRNLSWENFGHRAGNVSRISPANFRYKLNSASSERVPCECATASRTA